MHPHNELTNAITQATPLQYALDMQHTHTSSRTCSFTTPTNVTKHVPYNHNITHERTTTTCTTHHATSHAQYNIHTNTITFFLPIITLLQFQSDSCREEHFARCVAFKCRVVGGRRYRIRRKRRQLLDASLGVQVARSCTDKISIATGPFSLLFPPLHRDSLYPNHLASGKNTKNTFLSIFT